MDASLIFDNDEMELRNLFCGCYFVNLIMEIIIMEMFSEFQKKIFILVANIGTADLTRRYHVRPHFSNRK